MASASVSKKKKITKAQIEQFCSITDTTKDTAKHLLEACHGDVEMAINMHMEEVSLFESRPATSAASSSFSSALPSLSEGEVSGVRAPIPQKQQVLVEPGYEGYAIGFGGKRKQVRSVFDGFRDFEAEARQQEEALLGGGSRYDYKKKKTLEDLFRPPLDLIYRGTFQNARDVGAATNKWIMVNVQNSQEFACQALNRDVWSNQAVKSIIQEHFIFWQVYMESEEGQRYMTFYKVPEWPYIAIIDPRTGENMCTWNKLDAVSFCHMITEFLTQHPSLDGIHSPPTKKFKSECILDETEDTQMEAAIQASLTEVSASCEDSFRNELKSDSESEVETFSDTESSTATDNLRHEHLSHVTEKYDTEVSNNERVRKKLLVQEDVAEDDKDIDILKESNSSGSESLDVTSDKGENSSDSWKDYVGSETDPESVLMLRFPDGQRKQLPLPSSSRLLAVIKYVAEKGFSSDQYELVTNFPRRQISSMDPQLTLKEAGLFPQEAVFVQAK